jgi:hypothetical protein
MHQVLRRYWAGKTDVVRLEADAAHQKKLFFLLMWYTDRYTGLTYLVQTLEYLILHESFD